MHTANLRNLRPERTLVLVNGKRFTPANESGLVDLSRIPDALIERIDVITGGASAVYGSDAIAGAINFILKDDFEGLDIRYGYGQSFKSDGQNNDLDITFGTNFANDRGNVTVSTSWSEQRPVLFEDREYSEFNMDVRDGKLVRAGSGNIPGTRFSLSVSQLASLQGVNLTDFTTDKDFANGGAGSCGRVSGVRFGRNGVPLPFCDPEDRFNTNTTNYLLRPMERYQISSLASFAITDTVEAYSELFFTHVDSTWNLNASSFRPRTSGQQGLTLPSYYTNPTLYSATREFIKLNAHIFDPEGDGDAYMQSGGRRLNEAGSRYFNYQNTSYSLTGGLRGDFDLGGNDWQWDTFYQFQNATEAQTYTNGLSTLRLSLGVDVTVNAAGVAECTNKWVGCVPVNVIGLNAVTPEMAHFLTPVKGDQEYFSRKVFGASINGDLFEMPAGDVASAFGVEYRNAGYDFLPGGLNESGPNGNQLLPLTGTTSVMEIFSEFRVPLLADRAGVESLNLELAARYSDYSSSGGHSTYKVGLEYAPTDWIRFRGSYNRAVRAPNLAELYSPQKLSFEGGNDPCNAQLSRTQAVKDFCVLTGVPAGDIETFIPTVDLHGRRGGNPKLGVEEADTTTIGFVVSPPGVEGLNFTVDWYDIQVNDAIATIKAATVLQTCFTVMDVNSEFCKSVTRLPNGLVQEVLAIANNIANLRVSGMDFSFDYTRDLPDGYGLGGEGAVFAIRGLTSWLFQRESQQVQIAPTIECAGFVGGECSGFGARMAPDFGLKVDFRYMSGALSFGTTARTIGQFDFYPTETRGGPFNNEVPAETYWDIDANYQFSDSVEAHIMIKNVADNEPQLMGQQLQGDSGVDVGLYDVVGRRFTVGVRYLFE
jgi:iron complex outermembrane receptor protein